MRHKVLFFLSSFAVAGLGACTQQPKADAPPGVQPDVATGQQYLVADDTNVRYAPTDATSVAHPLRPKRTMSNWIATLGRGERLSVTGASGDWLQIVSATGVEGWIKRSDLIAAEDAMFATVNNAAPAFDEPLMDTMREAAVAPGTLLIVTHLDESFARVNIGPGQDAWMLADSLSLSNDDVAAARLLQQARKASKRSDTMETSLLFDKLRLKFPNSPFVDLAAEEVTFSEFRELPVLGTHLVGE